MLVLGCSLVLFHTTLRSLCNCDASSSKKGRCSKPAFAVMVSYSGGVHRLWEVPRFSHLASCQASKQACYPGHVRNQLNKAMCFISAPVIPVKEQMTTWLPLHWPQKCGNMTHWLSRLPSTHSSDFKCSGLLFFFWGGWQLLICRQNLCSHSCPGTLYIDQAGPHLTDSFLPLLTKCWD